MRDNQEDEDKGQAVKINETDTRYPDSKKDEKREMTRLPLRTHAKREEKKRKHKREKEKRDNKEEEVS